ncbi:MAG: hypothetical protein OSB43_07020 [Nocardioides sp.]|uniref:hypothetical protein n=3 Tax=Nocardioides sp. TaxID=35761 RepID=UPI000C8ADE19|nr:hypothetical protein [Nocardioides sp.]MAS54555.1 hypothetical protein [Pimelobacter sp.]MDE0776005.1 hypothetical protein [Nocardioides sp.]
MPPPEPTETADPAASAAPEPAVRSEQGSHRAVGGSPNRTAWLMVLPWAAVTTAVLAPFVVSRHPDQSTASSIGAVAGPAVLVAVVCALVAWRSTSAWSWWLYPPIVVIPAVALVVLTNEVPDRLENVPQDVGDQGNRSLVAPEQAGPWTLQTGAGPQAQEAELRERLLRADETLEPVYGQYRRAADDILVYNGINVPASTDLARELVGTPEDALRDYLDGTGIVDVVDLPPGDLSGAMACGTIPRLGPYVDLVVCGWADSGGIGTATYRVDGINLESAAETTRDFRADVTVTD